MARYFVFPLGNKAPQKAMNVTGLAPHDPARERPAAYWDQTMAPLGHPTVYPSEPTATGLLDANGNPIWRSPDPIGFLPSHDEQGDSTA